MKNLIKTVFFILVISPLLICGQDLPAKVQEEMSKLSKEEQIDYLLSKSEEYLSIKGDESLLYAKSAFNVAKDISDKHRILQAYVAMMKSNMVLANYDTIIEYAGHLLTEKEKESEELKYETKKLLIRVYERKADYAKARSFVEEVMQYYTDKQDSLSIAEVTKKSADISWQLGDFPGAIELYQRSLRISESRQDTNFIILVYSSLGNMYLKMMNFESAKKYLLKAYSISEGYENQSSYKTLMSYLGGYYNRMHIHDSAAYFYDKSLDISLKLNKRDDLAGAYLNLGNLQCRLGNFDIGKAYFDTALVLFENLNMRLNMAKVYDSYSIMYTIRKNYDSSIYYMQKRLDISKELKEADGIKRSLYILAANYDKKGDYKSSLKYAKKHILFTDSIVGDEIQSKIADYEAKYETAKKERDIMKLKAEQKAQKAKELVLWISFSSIFVILLLLVWFIIQRRKKDKIIYQQEQLVLKKEKDLADVELEKSKLQEEELKKEIQYKSKQLTTHALNMMQKNTLMQEIQQELVEVSKKANQDNKPILNRIKMLIKKNLRSEKDWDLFKLYFEDVNKNFYEDLQKLSADLTSNDLKLCALLKLNMNIKESASVLNIEPASVKTARYKLRKKLGLQPEEDLTEFIRKIG
jgi:tetratricopeptide (TPR) repeat protein